MQLSSGGIWPLIKTKGIEKMGPVITMSRASHKDIGSKYLRIPLETRPIFRLDVYISLVLHTNFIFCSLRPRHVWFLGRICRNIIITGDDLLAALAVWWQLRVGKSRGQSKMSVVITLCEQREIFCDCSWPVIEVRCRRRTHPKKAAP